jgi:hypothetical protein
MAWHEEGGWFHRSKKHGVIRSTGRAIRHTSKVVHRLLLLGTAFLVAASCLLAGAAWRLAQGPIDLGWLSDRMKAALIDDTAPVRLSFDGVSLAWEGFHKGVDHPLDLRLSNISINDPAGRHLIAAPQAHLTFSLAGLLHGRIVPRAIEVDHAQIAVTREPDGAVNLGWDLGGGESNNFSSVDIRQFVEQLSRPASSDHERTRGLFDQIERTHFRDIELTLRDRKSGLAIKALGMDLDLIRARAGQVRGSLRAPLVMGEQRADLGAEMNWTTGSGASLDLKLTAVTPARVGDLPSAVAFLGRLDVPISISATVAFDAHFTPSQIRAEVQAGPGHIQIAQGSVPMRSGTFVIAGTPNAITVTDGRFDVASRPDGNPQLIDVAGTIAYSADRLTAALTAGLTRIDIGDLPLLWPRGVGDSARAWVTEHVTNGVVTHATIAAVVESDGALHDVVITKARGDLDVSDGTFTWIDNVPPVEKAEAQLRFVDPDVLNIHLSAGRQRIRDGGADISIKDGLVRISGLAIHDQIAVIHVQVEGSVASALTLLKEPRLHLLSAHPINLKTGGGDVSAALNFQLPLQNNLSIDDIEIHADAHLKRVRLLDVVGGHELEDGVFDLVIDKEGLTLKGQGSLAAVPVAFDGALDFKPGTADQVVQKITVTGRPDAVQLDAAGLHILDVVAGPIPVTAVVIENRGGGSSVAVTADLTLATLSITPLAWSKPASGVANASATLLMAHDKLMKIDRIIVRGDGLFVTGSADLIDSHIRAVLLDTIRLGRTQGHGTVRSTANEPIAIVLQGDQIDLAPKLTEKAAAADRSDTTQMTTPNWTLDAHFDRALLANGIRANDVLAKAVGGGEMIRLLDAVGSTGAGSGFSIKIEPQPGTTRAGERRLQVDAKDAGTFLRGMDVSRAIQSGHLMIDGAFNRPFGMYPLAGTAVIDDVEVRNSPVLGKLLQAITLYGLVDALRGPGMNFSHVVVPFNYTGPYLDIDQAHANNPSLGLTGKGRVLLSSGQTSITGTIVPAYFFNSMLGQLPLVGRLFSPEKGGGVFAVRFGLDGSIDDPSVSINPVSALTPGFMREIFGIFDRTAPGNDGVPLNGNANGR